MDSRPIMKKKGRLGIFLDSSSLEKLISASNARAIYAKVLLKYHESEPFEFLRSPLETSNDELKGIVQYNKKFDGNGNLTALEVVSNKSQLTMMFGYTMQDIDAIARKIYGKVSVSDDERETITLVSVQAALNRFDTLNVFVTNNKTILKNRLWFESHFPGCPLNIVTLEEAIEIMDLFAKSRNKFYISSNYICNKGYWYWLLFRSKIPFFRVGDPFLDAFSSRFVYLLMSLDEMGFQYYSGVNNDTMDNTLYHFNYFISLVSGIFDSLAIKTKNQYNLTFNGDHIPSRTSLSKAAGEEFLKALRRSNPDLRRHINDYVNFIKLIYKLRELILHREGLKKSRFRSIDSNGKWESNFIGISKAEIDIINELKDSKQDYQNTTFWGVYKVHEEFFLDPYVFAKAAIVTLIRFSNRYLELLGFSNAVNELRKKRPDDDFIKTIDIFSRDHLDWYLE